jgi:ABC transporter substrate binding protein
MSRRDFIVLLGSAAAGLAWPLAVRAQGPAMPLVGALHSASPAFFAPWGEAFRAGLKETGYVEHQNVAIEYRFGEGHYERLPELVADLLARKVDVLLAAGGTDPAKAAKAATTTTPIVFVSAADPVRNGLVASLNRPGGNVTGVSLLVSALAGKQLDLLHALVPGRAVAGSRTPVCCVRSVIWINTLSCFRERHCVLACRVTYSSRAQLVRAESDRFC